MFNVGLKIKSRQDAAEFIKKTHTRIPTHFYEYGYFSNTQHLATPEEGREYLDLLLELAKTFPENNPEFVRYNGACFLTVARLMTLAEVELSDYDKRHILDYTTIKYDSDYLNYACQIRDAETMLHYIADFWDQVSMLELYYQEASKALRQKEELSWFRFIKRFRLAHRFTWWQDGIREKTAWIGNKHVPRVCGAINSNYQSNLEFTHPLIFYHYPTSIAGKLFPDQQTESEVRAEWESCDIYLKFGDEKLARLLDLLPGFTMSYSIFHPTTGEQITKGVEQRQYVIAEYPELEPYYDKYLAFNLLENGDGRVSDETIRSAVQSIAEVFGIEQYLPMANYSRRQELSQAHPEADMSDEDLSVVNAILEFMKNTD